MTSLRNIIGYRNPFMSLQPIEGQIINIEPFTVACRQQQTLFEPLWAARHSERVNT